MSDTHTSTLHPEPHSNDTADTLDVAHTDADVAEHIEQHKTRPGPLLPILHAIQNDLGYIPERAIPTIAKHLNLSRAEVHGVVSFYHHFTMVPRGRHIVEVCCAESCQAVGGRSLEALAKETLGLNWHETSRDGQITLEPVYCLGNCACSPSVRVGKQILGRVDEARFKALLDELTTQPLTLLPLGATSPEVN